MPPLNATADDLLHLIHKTLVAGELAALQRLAHQRRTGVGVRPCLLPPHQGRGKGQGVTP